MDIDTEQLVAGISAWMACESPSHDAQTLWRMAELVRAHAAERGLTATTARVQSAPDAPELPLLTISNRAPGDARPGLLVLGHIDTVHPIGTVAHNPIRTDGDRLYGPGGYDMKAGVYLALTALGMLAKPGSTALPVDMLLVPDEEVGSHASRASIESLARQSRYCLVAEPARANGGRCVTARKGSGSLTLRVHGVPAHAGIAHEKGRSAVREMAHQILALESLTDYARGITVSVGTISGGTTSNTVPAACECEVDFRFVDMASGQELVSKLQALTPVGPDVRLELAVAISRPPMVRDAKAQALLERVQHLAREVDLQLEEAPITGGASDANFTSAVGLPSLDALGPEGDGAHTWKEHVLVSSLAPRVRFWRHVLAHLD